MRRNRLRKVLSISMVFLLLTSLVNVYADNKNITEEVEQFFSQSTKIQNAEPKNINNINRDEIEGFFNQTDKGPNSSESENSVGSSDYNNHNYDEYIYDDYYDYENDYNYEDYYDYEDYDYSYKEEDNYDSYYEENTYDDYSNNNVGEDYIFGNYYNPYSEDDFSFIDDYYSNYDYDFDYGDNWGPTIREEPKPGDKFLKTPKTIQYSLDNISKYPIYKDTGIKVVDGKVDFEGLREIFYQISVKSELKMIEDIDRLMILVGDELFVLEGNVENEEVLEEIFEKITSMSIKTESSRIGGKFSLADYLEMYKELPVEVDGELVELIIEPTLDNSRVLFPIRSIADALDSDIKWNKEKSEATITKGDKTIKIKSDEDTITVNDKTYLITNKTKLNKEEERLLSVIKLLVTELEGTMQWDSGSGKLVIETPNGKKSIDEELR